MPNDAPTSFPQSFLFHYIGEPAMAGVLVLAIALYLFMSWEE